MGDEESNLMTLIVDDDPRFRAQLRLMLGRGQVTSVLGLGARRLQIVAEAGDGETAVALTPSLAPDVVLMDLAMPRLDGLEATRRIKRDRPETRVIVLTVQDEEAYRRAAADSGADGYVLKKSLMGDAPPAVAAPATPARPDRAGNDDA